ncbi:GGDEF domain-containing protein [Paenibacillus sp. 1011MAR3C5]|uniref:GGDEF domain-containing protein n=1 Tax=Paenibacillus sp. 1011MAR3C5 TaxID=1675787 RepID=UPI000E6B767D|nr:GGDEF domain-containing protein [Paenibacillus sp. 1011MAR3C5]RJE89019.1 GGDEF domain-containing protein [Paenibacillus sp. 1011MAR3C5]
MSSHVRSIEDAAAGIIHTLKHISKVNTICVTANDGTLSNRIIGVYNRNEQLVPYGAAMPILPNSLPHQTIEFHHIPSVIDDSRMTAPSCTPFISDCSMVSVSIYKAESASLIGSICLLDKSPIELSEAERESLQSMSSLLGYMIELESASLTDSLTGLYNRRYLTHLCNNGSDKLYTVLFIDIDDFKEVNDRYGHDTGDFLLQEIASRLRASVRRSDVLIRYGGDEFLICFQHLACDGDLSIIADKIKLSLKQPYLIGGQLVYIYASVGMSSKQGGGSTLRELITDADHSMYDMKNSDKND